MSRILRVAIVSLFFLSTIVLAASVANFALHSKISFDSAAWRNGDQRVRARMIHDISNSKLLLGKTRSEIDGLLGPPDQTSQQTWDYRYLPGGVLKDTLRLPYHDWSYTLHIEFATHEDRVRMVSTFD
ncbi:MAG: hypothetical protein QM811_02195 [Pirellulales bacterium]